MQRAILNILVCFFALLVFGPAASAQFCCGHAGYVIVPCPTCQEYYNVTECSPGGGNSDYAPVRVDCSSNGGCGRVATYAFAGYCYSPSAKISNVVLRTHAAGAAPRLVYRNAFVRNCKGEFVAVRFAVVQPPA